jgi:hypothetical protein
MCDRPTIRLSRAAERAILERHGHTKEYMFVHRRWRRRLQAAVGPGHGRRRDVGMPDRGYGRDTEVADGGRDMTRRDRATDPIARDPAPGDTARDDHPHTTGHTRRDPARGHPAAAARWCGGPMVRRPDDVL